MCTASQFPFIMDSHGDDKGGRVEDEQERQAEEATIEIQIVSISGSRLATVQAGKSWTVDRVRESAHRAVEFLIHEGNILVNSDTLAACSLTHDVTLTAIVGALPDVKALIGVWQNTKGAFEILAPAHEKVRFAPSIIPFGMQVDRKSGVVTSVSGGQAEQLGVKRFWRIDTIEGRQYSKEIFKEFFQGRKPFHVTFWKPSEDGRFGGLVFQEVMENQETIGGPLFLLPDGWWNAEMKYLSCEKRNQGDLGFFRVKLNDDDQDSVVSQVLPADNTDWTTAEKVHSTWMHTKPASAC